MSDHTETIDHPVPSSPSRTHPHSSPSSTVSKQQHHIKPSPAAKRNKPASTSRRAPSRLSSAPAVGVAIDRTSTMPRRSTSPSQGLHESVHFTKTGRVSKAKKGLKVHNCECGRSYTRAEHLRRHQRNHAQDALRCNVSGCGKPFFRLDLLQRHQERHNEVDGPLSPPSAYSPESIIADVDIEIPNSAGLPNSTVAAFPPHTPHTPYYRPAPSPLPDTGVDASTKHLVPYTTAASANLTSVPMEVLPPHSVPWDHYGHPDAYSSSSEYDSPVHTTHDYTDMFATHPYPPEAGRTRASSNASYGEPWVVPPHSPTSATSTLPYNWGLHEKSPAPSHVDYMPTSYPMAGVPNPAVVNSAAHFGPFEHKTMAQRDDEEHARLFPEQSYGMGQIAHSYPSEQYLDNFWRLFHPTLPIVHRTAVASIDPPPMLHAAMIAIGGQYSSDPSVRTKSRLLHDRCVKLLDKRGLDAMLEPERLCDWQATLFVEVMSQYRARRAARALSPRFQSMYRTLSESIRDIAATINDHVAAIAHPGNVTYARWMNWVDSSTQQRLLQACYILDYQQAVYLARTPQYSKVEAYRFAFPLPAHIAVWEALNPPAWAFEARKFGGMPTYIHQVTADLSGLLLDQFQSSVLIAANYNHFTSSAPYPAPPRFVAIEHLLDQSAFTVQQLLVARLLQVVPIRALLAVASDSWILFEKVTSPQDYALLKGNLKAWLGPLWTRDAASHDSSVKTALRISISILRHCSTAPRHLLRLEFGGDAGLYFATLVLWVVTTAATSRDRPAVVRGPVSRLQSCSPVPGDRAFSSHLTPRSSSASPTPRSDSKTLYMPIAAKPVSEPLAMDNDTSADLNVSVHDFLDAVLSELDYSSTSPQWPRDIMQWQRGCSSVMLWTKLRVQAGATRARDSVMMPDVNTGPTSVSMGRGGEGFGEVLDSIVSNLTKMVGRGWHGWGL